MFVLTFTNSVPINDFDEAIEKIAKVNNNKYVMVLVGTKSDSESQDNSEKFVNLL